MAQTQILKRKGNNKKIENRNDDQQAVTKDLTSWTQQKRKGKLEFNSNTKMNWKDLREIRDRPKGWE